MDLHGYGPDISELSIYPGKIIWNTILDDDIDRSEEIEQACSYIRSLYQPGTPFFTKKGIRNLHEQLQDRSRSTFYIPALDGSVVEVENETGKVLPGPRTELERIL